MPKRDTNQSNAKAYQDAILTAIWNNQVDTLRELLKSYDANLTRGTPIISVAKMLKRTECVSLLREYSADETFARHYDIAKLYALFFEKDSNITLKIKVRGLKKTIPAEVDKLTIYPSYATKLMKEAFESYQRKYPSKKIKTTIDILHFAIKNYFSCNTHLHNSRALFASIQKGFPTLVNSGWQGEVNHVIDVIFYKDCMIVGDGLKNHVTIYQIDKTQVKRHHIEQLLACPQGSKAHQKLIEKIASHHQPARIRTKTQQHGNCTIFSLLSAIEGLWYTMEMRDNGFDHAKAAQQASRERANFNQFVKNNVTKKINELKKRKDFSIKEETTNSFTINLNANRAALGAAAIFLGVTISTGMLMSNLIIAGTMGIYAVVFAGYQYRENYIQSQVKNVKKKMIKTNLSQSQKSALKAGVAANKSYFSQFSSWGNLATYRNSREYYLGLGLNDSQMKTVKKQLKAK